MALQLGRPRMINALDCTVSPPIDCEFPLEPSRTLFTPVGAGDKPSSYTIELVKYETAHIIHRYMSMGAGNDRFKDYKWVQVLHNDVIELLNKLPPAMRTVDPDLSWEGKYPDMKKQRLQIALVIYTILMALHRPHASSQESSRTTAIDSALRVLQESEKLFEISKKHHYKIYTLMLHNVDAGLFLAAAAAKYPDLLSGPQGEQILHALGQAVSRLRVLKERNSSAIIGEQVLDKCLQKLRKSSQINHDASNNAVCSSGSIPFHPEQDTNVIGGHSSDLVPTQTWSTPENMPTWGTELVGTPWDGRDLFDEVTNSKNQTMIWLEQMDMTSSTFDMQNTGYNWDALLSQVG